MPNVLSGIVLEVADGFIVLSGGIRITVSSRLVPAGLAVGAHVVVSARLRGAEWVAEDVAVKA